MLDFNKMFQDFNFQLYFVLFARLIMPTVYQTFRISVLGSLPSTHQIDVASQLSWVEVIIKIIDEIILQPLYFCLGCTIEDVKITKNKIKTGLVVSGIVYSILCSLISIGILPLVQLMGQNHVSESSLLLLQAHQVTKCT